MIFSSAKSIGSIALLVLQARYGRILVKYEIALVFL